MKKSINNKRILTGIISLALSLVAVSPNVIYAATNIKTITSTNTTNQATLSSVISKGDAAIAERLTKLSSLIGTVNSTTNKLTASDRSYLLTEINSELSGLSSLKTQLYAETSVTNAKTDFQNIFLQYRVFALVAPKVTMIKASDDQIGTEAKLSTLATKLQTRINDVSKSGKDVSQMQSWLNSMVNNDNNAQPISTNVEDTVLPLVPSQYDANHAILSGDLSQLQQAKSDNQNSFTYANDIINQLKTIK